MVRGGAITLLVASAMLVGGCKSDPAVEVRPIGVSARGAAVGDKIALGHAALAIGNVGLALQEFRESLRVDSGSIDALSGIARCYDEMGRVDLSRRYYEEALALAPADLPLLRKYAASLARHGALAEAQAVISEIATRSKAPAVQWALEPARAAPQSTAEVIAVAADAASETVTVIAAPAPARAVAASATARIAPAKLAAKHAPLPTVTKKVRLERLSLGEIALVTTGAPLWVALPAATPARSVRLLNAARREGLAARHRKQLYGSGWRSVAIGNAPHVRKSSLVLYPTGQRSEARRLADNLRIVAIRPEPRRDILILLGRDRG